LWRGVIEEAATPMVVRVKAFRVMHRETIAEQRASIKEQLPEEKPQDMSDKSWDSIRMWCDGYGYKAIAKETGISEAAISERIRRGLSRLGLMRLPEGYKRKRGPQGGNALKRTVTAPHPR
jgi:DNA-binding NarL/FixJ family response regulator